MVLLSSFSQAKATDSLNPGGIEAEQENSVVFPIKTNLSIGGCKILSSYSLFSVLTATVYLKLVAFMI